MYVLVEDVDNGVEVGYSCVEAGVIGEVSVLPSPQFCCEPKTALENKAFTKKRTSACPSSAFHHLLSLCMFVYIKIYLSV